MTLHKTYLSIIALAITLSAGSAAAQLIELHLSRWYMEPAGTVTFGSALQLGSDIDIRSDLGYDDYENIGGFTVRLGRDHAVGVEYLSADLSSRSTVIRSIRFMDLVFPVSTSVESEMEAVLVRPHYRLTLGSKILRGGLEAGLQMVDYTAKLDAAAVGSAQNDLEAVIPVVGAHAEAHPLPFLHGAASVNAARWEWQDVEVELLDLKAHLIATFPPAFYAGLGYRHTEIFGSDRDSGDEIDLELSGPYAFAGLRF